VCVFAYLGIGIKADAAGIRHLSTVPEHSGTGLGPLIPVPDWFRHLHYFSILLVVDRSTYNLHVHRRLVVVVLNLLCDVDKL
jgi:hypothetical protein